MVLLLGFTGLLVLIFLLSKSLSLELGRFFFRLFHDEGITVKILAFLFLPGTVVHEFSHAAVAQMLGVYVGEVELMPKVEGDVVKLGAVHVAETDPIRRFLIGVAPLLVGLVLLFIALALYQRFGLGAAWWWGAIFYYAVFQVGNAMFSSRRDMEGAIELGIAILILIGVLYFFGLRFSVVSILENTSSQMAAIFKLGVDVLLRVAVVDLILIVLCRGGNFLLRKR